MPLLRGTWRKRRRGEGGEEEGGHLSLAAHEAVLLAVVEPVAGAARPDYTLQLVGLHLVAVAVLVEVVGGGGGGPAPHPDDLVDPLVAPELEALPAQLHGATRHPQEDQPLVLQLAHGQPAHLVVAHGAVGELHVDVPGRVRHQHRELAQHWELQVPEVALHPLRRHQLGALWAPQEAGGALLPPAALRGTQLQGHVRLVHLVVDVLAGVHVEAGVEEGAIAQGLVRVLLQDLHEVQLVAGRGGAVHPAALALGGVLAE